jgi:acetyl esterase/lipase
MRKAAGVAVVGVAALAFRRYTAWRKAMSAVTPELRTPAALLTGIPMNALTLPLIRALMGWRSRPEPGVTLTEHRVGDGSIEVLVQAPADRSARRPAVLWLHGGGLCAGSAQLEAQPAGRLAGEIGAVVVSPNYRLAPENPFPAALDDCMAVLAWMVKDADELGIDPSRIGLYGWSSGGGLAAAVAQRALDEGVRLRAQALVSPMLDDRTALRDDLSGRGELTWSPRSNRWAWTAYLGRRPRIDDAPEYAAPARRADVAGLPAAWIGVGDLEVFYDEGVDYAAALKSAGVPCELVTVQGMYHTADGVRQDAPSMRRFRSDMVEHLRTYLDTTPSSA